jgi:hypothetical protein
LDQARAAGPDARVHAPPVLNDELGVEQMISFLREIWMFMRVRKKFWLMPILIMMVLFGGLVVLTKGSAVAPFIYTIF